MMAPVFKLVILVLISGLLSLSASENCPTPDATSSCEDIRVVFGDQVDEFLDTSDYTLDAKYRTKYIFSDVRANWFRARELCELFGYQFASIRSETELQWFKQDFNTSGHTHSVWLGGSDLSKEGDFRWATLPSSRVDFTNWFEGEPNNAGDNENCFYSFYGNEKYDFLWNDYLCTEQLYFACQTPKYDQCETQCSPFVKVYPKFKEDC